MGMIPIPVPIPRKNGIITPLISTSVLIQRLREERTCKICLDATAAMLFDPCGHLSTCARCSSSLTECPMCRNRIRKKIKVFM